MTEQRQLKTDGERLATLEVAVSHVVEKLDGLSTSFDKVAEGLGQLRGQQGRHDFRTMAAWAGVVVAMLSATISPMIAFMVVLGAREVDRIDETSARDVMRIEEKIDANSNTGNVIQMREQIKLNAVVANIYRDENARIMKMLGDKMAVDIPPPTFYPDAQEAPSP